MKSKVVFACTIAVSVFALSACTVNFGSNDHMDGNGHVSTDTNATYDSSALMFASMMIPHHEQAVVMADMVLEISKSPELLVLAAEIKAAQQPEIEQMQGWLDTDPDYNSMHMDHSTMQGMLSDSELDSMRNLTGTKFDNAFLRGMIEHHQGAIVMAEMITDSTIDEVQRLGIGIIEAQTAEIALMKTMIK